MVSLESFARREATATEAADEAVAATGRRQSKGRRILGGLHCQRCLKRTKKGVRVAFVTSPPLVAAYAGFAACGLRAVFGVVLRAAHARGGVCLGIPTFTAARRARAPGRV